MTKVTILGQEPTDKKELKKIEFVEYLDITGKKIELEKCGDYPNQWENIILLSKKYRGGIHDLMLCYDETTNCDKDSCAAILVIGHFNDGIV